MDKNDDLEESGISENFSHRLIMGKELIPPEFVIIVKDEESRVLATRRVAGCNGDSDFAICVFSAKLPASRFVQLQGLTGKFFYQSFTWDNIVKDFSKLYGKACLNPLNKLICDGFIPLS